MEPRRRLLLRGTPAETRREAERLTAALPPSEVLWVGPRDTSAKAAQRRLGAEVMAVVLDLHEGLQADLLGQVEGLISGGGALVLRAPHGAVPGPPGLAVHPFSRDDVGCHLGDRLLAEAPEAQGAPPLSPRRGRTAATAEQDRLVNALVGTLQARGAAVVLADRGRGKSAALGRAAAASGLRCVVVSLDPHGCQQVCAFGPPGLVARSPAALLEGDLPWDGVLVDEAARIPVPVLMALTQRVGDHALVLSTTTRGYEGTGRGFSLRFVPWLEARRPVARHTLHTPIRWPPGDPVERWLRAGLLLDAPLATPSLNARPQLVRLDKARLAADGELLGRVFALLVHAHYRTTPGDLQRLLDAPNLHLFAALDPRDRPLAVNLVALEGGFSAEEAARYRDGRGRMVGHALADSLVVHLGRAQAGPLRMMRSVRIATHPEARRLGVATRLLRVAERWARDQGVQLFGTVFGATPGVLRFRAQAGYLLVRVGGSRGARTGAPAAVMVRPEGDAATALVADLRRELSWALPAQLDLLGANPALGLDGALRSALEALAPRAERAPTDAETRLALAGALHGPRTMDSVLWAAERWLASSDALARLSGSDRALVEARVLQRRSWQEVQQAAGLPTRRATQRGLKRALRGVFGG